MTNHDRVEIQSHPRPTRRRQGRPHSNSTTSKAAQLADLDGLTAHLGYLIRRAQIWIFQDFIRTLATVNIRPAQYSVLTVIDANPGLTQMSLSKALGIERARLVHLLDGLEARRFRGTPAVSKRSAFARLAPYGQGRHRPYCHQGTRARTRTASRRESWTQKPPAAATSPSGLRLWLDPFPVIRQASRFGRQSLGATVTRHRAYRPEGPVLQPVALTCLSFWWPPRKYPRAAPLA